MSYDEDSIDWEEFPSGSLFFDFLGTPVVWESAPNGAAFVLDPDQRPCPLGLILEYGREIGRRDFNSVWANARFDQIRLGCGAYSPKALRKPSLISRQANEYSGVVRPPAEHRRNRDAISHQYWRNRSSFSGSEVLDWAHRDPRSSEAI